MAELESAGGVLLRLDYRIPQVMFCASNVKYERYVHVGSRRSRSVTITTSTLMQYVLQVGLHVVNDLDDFKCELYPAIWTFSIGLNLILNLGNSTYKNSEINN